MDNIQIRANAKINFSLNVHGKKSDGYHEISTIMQSIDLSDNVSIKKADNGIIVNCLNAQIPANDGNIAYSAASAFLKETKINHGVVIDIEKNIPIAAGLAGGSADAAAVLKGLNILFDTGLTVDELCGIGILVGADVPFCIIGGTVLATGIGEKIQVLKALKNVHILIIKPDVDVSTKEIYHAFDKMYLDENNFVKKDEKDLKFADNEILIQSIENGDIYVLSENIVNQLENVTLKKHNDIKIIKSKMIQNGAINAMMSGSGSTVFGVYESSSLIENAFEELKKEYSTIFMSKTT